MNEPIIEGNCGERCNFHCCRSHENSERLGMYLLPGEYEAIQSENLDYEIHTKHLYDLPKGIKKLVYLFCPDDSECLRELRPIQCRTYPFEPHYINGELSLVIEKNQLHNCPLISEIAYWRHEFIEGVYRGWLELIKIESVLKVVKHQTFERLECNNIDINLSKLMIESKSY